MVVCLAGSGRLDGGRHLACRELAGLNLALAGQPASMTGEDEQLIDHAKITDGFDELTTHRIYRPLATFCGVCDLPIVVSPREQKYLLEVKGVPVKRLRLGAAFCQPCAARRSRVNYLARSERWRQEPNGGSELAALRSEEREAQARSHQRFRQAEWPYAARSSYEPPFVNSREKE